MFNVDLAAECSRQIVLSDLPATKNDETVMRRELPSLRKINLSLLLTGLVVAIEFLISSPFLSGELTYRDKLGHVVDIETPVKRAAVLQLYDCLPPLQAWDRIGCLAHYCLEDDVLMATVPGHVRRLASGMGDSGSVNMEKLLQVKPDIVLIWTSGSQQIEFMRRQGLKVIAVYPESIGELYDVMDMLGRLFDRQAAMAATQRRMDLMLKLVREHVARVAPAKRQKVLWISSRPTSVASGIGVNNDLIRLIGGLNVAGYIQARNVDVSLEQIVRWNPDVIFIWSGAPYTASDILHNPQWRTIRAVRNGRVYKTPKWSTWSPRLAPTALWMEVRTYPATFQDVDLNAQVDRFYREVYGVSYSKVNQIED